MKVIDLLNKIANNEEVPEKIKCHWEYVYTYDDTREEYAYIQNDGTRFDDDWLVCNILNNEIEIIEEDKEIEEIEFEDIDELTDYDIYCYPECSDDSRANFKNKINELIRNQKKLIEAVNELKKGK